MMLPSQKLDDLLEGDRKHLLAESLHVLAAQNHQLIVTGGHQ